MLADGGGARSMIAVRSRRSTPSHHSATATRRNPMLPLRFPVDVVMERVPLQNRWATERWQPDAVDSRGRPGLHPSDAPA